MKKLVLIPLLLLFVSACATDAPAPVQQTEQETHTHKGAYELADGSYVFISDDGTMRMTDRNGKPVIMQEDVEMELKDGHTIMMKNNRIWHSEKPIKTHDHRKMK
jgi:uncharacterized protein YxjI